MSAVTALGVLGAALVWYAGVHLVAGAIVSAIMMTGTAEDWSYWQSGALSAGTAAALTAATAAARSWPLPAAAAAGAAGAWLAVPLAAVAVPRLVRPSPARSPPPS